MINKFNKGDLLYIGDNKKAYWGLPQGYPYKEGVTIEWDGNTEGLYCVNDTWYLVSDEVISDDVLRNGIMIGIDGNGVIEKPVGPYWDVLVQAGLISEDVSGLLEAMVVVVRKPGVSLMGEGPFERTGTYFTNAYGTKITKFVSETIHPMAPEFLSSATLTTYGVVKQMPYLPNATGDIPTAENFNQLVRGLKSAGLMK